MEKIDPVEMWDKKKIAFAAVVLVALIGLGFWSKVFVLGKNKQKSIFQVTNEPSGVVAGASTEGQDTPAPSSKDNNHTPSFSFSPPNIQANIQADAQQKLNEIKQQITNLNVADIASSSPQVQKVINDLKSLQEYPKDQAKQMCENICKSF